MNGPALVFVGVALLSMRDAAIEPGRTVVVEGDRITYAGPAEGARIPPGARRIDGGGRVLMPGLADMHVHLNLADELGLYLAHGITTVRNLRGEPRHLAWREDVRVGRRPGPTILTSGPTLGGSPLRNPAFTAVDSAEAAARVVGEQAKAGYDMVKVHSRLKPEAYAAIAEAARQRRLPVVGHFLPEVGLDAQVRERQASLEHVGDMADRLTDESAARIAAAGTSVTPLLATDYAGASPAARLAELLARPAQPWREPSASERRAIARLRDAKVPLLLGTDASLPSMRPGESLGLEMRSLTAAGVPAIEVLAAATRNAGAFVRDRVARDGPAFGTIEAGARADLILLDRSPLDDPRHALQPWMVVASGRLYETSDLARFRPAR